MHSNSANAGGIQFDMHATLWQRKELQYTQIVKTAWQLKSASALPFYPQYAAFRTLDL
jgi:hypothetical protein